jgi:hypothetical protein
MRAASSSGLSPSFVETAMVVDVDIETYRVSVLTQHDGQKALTELAFATPYQHYANGEGIYFMPEVGSTVWVCWPSDGSRPFVMAWAPAREENDSLRSNKMELNPGDIYLGTRDDNFCILRRGGVVQIGGGPLSQRMFIPVNNTIKDFCENYGLHSLGGDLEWTIQREEATTDGKRPALLKVRAKEYANDEGEVAVLQIGSHPDQAQNILSLVVNASGAKGAAKKISLEFRKDGSAVWKFENNVNWTVKKNLAVRADQNLTLNAGKLAELLSDQDIKLDAKKGTLDAKAATVMNLNAGVQVNVGPKLQVGAPPPPPSGDGGAPADSPKAALLADPLFLQWLLGHTHIVRGIGMQTGPAAASPSPPLPPSSQYISKNLTST